MNPAPLPPLALKLGRIDVKNPPPGRFLYSVLGCKSEAFEGRLLDFVPYDGLHWLKLEAGDSWLWSGDVNILVHLPEKEITYGPGKAFEQGLVPLAEAVKKSFEEHSLRSVEIQPPAPPALPLAPEPPLKRLEVGDFKHAIKIRPDANTKKTKFGQSRQSAE